MSYTPGPWRVKWSGQLGAHFEVHTDALPHRMVTGSVREDDAYLIAAAPETLVALETMVEMVEMNGLGKQYALDLAASAIKKARGEV